MKEETHFYGSEKQEDQDVCLAGPHEEAPGGGAGERGPEPLLGSSQDGMEAPAEVCCVSSGSHSLNNFIRLWVLGLPASCLVPHPGVF